MHLEHVASTTQKQYILFIPSSAGYLPGAIWNNDGTYVTNFSNAALQASLPLTTRPMRIARSKNPLKIL